MRRTAYTLLELMLVLAIIVVVAAVTFPTVEGMFSTLKERAASDAVRGAWATARSRAIDEARPYRFAYLPNKGNFRVAPDSPDFWNGESPPTNTDGSSTGFVLEGALPRGLRFIDTGAPTDDDGSATIVSPDSLGSAEWVHAATFLPDGTANDDVRIAIRYGGGRSVNLNLRGLTGAVTSAPSSVGGP